MSRSYRKQGVYRSSGMKDAKRYAAKKARRTDLDSGGAFKKAFCSYDICDYKRLSDDEVAKRK